MMNETWQVTHLNQSRHVERVNKLHIFILLMFWLVLTYPALSTGYIPSRDVLIHLLWSSHFSDQFWMGDLYPRWLAGMNGGYGSPVFFFYGPLPYYFTAILHPFFHADTEGWHQLGVAAALAVLFSGMAAYAWLKALSNESGALFGALLYMCAPYHLACDLYERFAFAELWAFVWLPLVLLMVLRITDGRRGAVVGLALSYGALTLTHLPSTMIFSWIPLLYAGLLGANKSRATNVGLTFLGMVLGLGVAAIYVIPALLTQHNVSFGAMQEGHYFYGYHFLYYGPRFNQEFATVVESQGRYAASMLLAAALAMLLGYWGQDRVGKQQSLFWMAVALVVFAMMLPVARPLWDKLPLLQSIQFPWRFNLLLTLAGTAVVALGIQTASDRGQSWKMLVLLAVCAYATAPTWRATVIFQMLSHTSGQASIQKIEQQFGSFNRNVREKASAAKLRLDVAEYRPHWVPSELLSSSHGFNKMVDTLRDAPKTIKAWLNQQAQEPGRIELTTHAPKTAWVPVHQFYYPNWVAHVAGSAGPLPTRPSAIDGRLEVQVPPGEQHVVVSFERGREERVGQVISLASLLILLALSWMFKHERANPPAIAGNLRQW